MKKLMLSLSLLTLSAGAFAQEIKIQTHELKTSSQVISAQQDPIATAGQVIDVLDRVVAVGERVYTLVQRGKPNLTTTYASLSVIPRDPISKEIVDVMDLEDCSYPMRKKYETVISKGSREVIRFEYELIFSHSCSYDGKGKYILAALIKPKSVVVKYGWDLNATMSLQGIMNHGKKTNPIMGANLNMKLVINNLGTAFEKDHTIHITGDGKVDAKQ